MVEILLKVTDYNTYKERCSKSGTKKQRKREKSINKCEKHTKKKKMKNQSMKNQNKKMMI